MPPLNSIIADPLKVPTFNFEHQRLTSQLHSHLTILKAAPSSHALSLFENSTASKIGSASYRVASDAYNKAAIDVRMSTSLSDLRDLRNDTLDMGKRAASLMSKSSEKPLEIHSGMSKVRVASKLRAEFASNYQLRLAYYIGTVRGWQLNKNSQKGWLLSSSHDLDDTCDDNENQGLISVFDFFQSGDMYPPAHLGCVCNLYLYLKKDNKR